VTAPTSGGAQINLSKVGVSTVSLAGAAWAMFVIARRSWRLLSFGDYQLLRFVEAPPAKVVEVASIFFIVSVGLLTAGLTVIALNKLSDRRRVAPPREANSIPEFTSGIKLRARPDEIAQREEEPEKRRERELAKWREEHKAQLERE
jgi:hypothetical protein